MTQQRLTQCPHCKASFKVSEEQLNAANGRVRCGACMNIFDAIAYSLSGAQDKPSSTSASPNKKEDNRDSLENVDDTIDLEQQILEEEPLFADNPEEDEKEGGYSGTKKLSDELSTAFLELEEDNEKDPYSTSFKKLEDDFVSHDAVDESWTQDILEDLDSQKSNQDSRTKKEPHISDLDSMPDLSLQSEFDEPESATPHNDFSNFDPATSIDPESSYEKINFEYQQDAEKKRHWFVSFLFVVANIILLLVLLAQTSWYHYDKLVRYPHIKSLYTLACEHLNCTLPRLEDLSKIRSQNLVVRSHPTARKALIIDTVMINEAAFEQDFPNIALYFSDINKNTIVQRLITKDEYLSGDLLSWEKMPVDQPIHISLEILDPGKEAVNYHLEFYSNYPAKSDN